ncbi:MAG: hypothetical protein IPJ27_16355 [Candidatus Accumulibacter sp.]|uniref:Uncharacterized protein n=1 Tax=Candidatus Accumulibacter proximus TaxID=2954385 RepID=A0A935UI56_9PROT|nr:hypothetical protein [Candidatus Accumulibacter proximus]
MPNNLPSMMDNPRHPAHVPITKRWHRGRTRPRVMANRAPGLLTSLALLLKLASSTRALVSWKVGAGCWVVPYANAPCHRAFGFALEHRVD